MDYTNYDARTRHTNADFFEAVSEHDLQQSAIVMAVFAYQSAMRGQADAAAARRRARQSASDSSGRSWRRGPGTIGSIASRVHDSPRNPPDWCAHRPA